MAGNKHPLKQIVEMQNNGIAKGIYSACSANEYVIEAVLNKALESDENVYIEATANQVNQYGGYTGMTPLDFRNFVYAVAAKLYFPVERIILGGDHLGPLAWNKEGATSAMEKSIRLIRQYVEAGFTKIHIDTSMRLADDDAGARLDTYTIAGRSAILCSAAQEAFEELRSKDANALAPVYIIGSEVPIPGGSQKDEGVLVTKPEDFVETVETFNKIYCQFGLERAWENVAAIVVQPGVEFGNETIHAYNRSEAKALCDTLKQYPNLVFEGHSTDYQTAAALKQMVEDRIAILKVGPALTFALRKGLFALSRIENELLRKNVDAGVPNFINVLEKTMVNKPENWEKHYHGSENRKRLARYYSFSDRARYYMPDKEVREVLELMMNNLKSVNIPLTLIDEYMPIQFGKIRDGILENSPEALFKDVITHTIDDYVYAISPGKGS